MSLLLTDQIDAAQAMTYNSMPRCSRRPIPTPGVYTPEDQRHRLQRHRHGDAASAVWVNDLLAGGNETR
jgi:hypothetical protein